jgi:hypothetical protein
VHVLRLAGSLMTMKGLRRLPLGLLWVVVCLMRVVGVEVAGELGVPLCPLLP